MTLRFMDGFQHYASASHMLDGVYAEIPGIGGPSTSFARTGTKSMNIALFNLRRPLGVTRTEVGVGAAYYFTALPGDTGAFKLCRWHDASNVELCRVEVQTTGALRVVNGSGTLLHETASPEVTAGAWQHVECFAVINDTTGAVEVRVNGVTVINITGVNTKGGGDAAGCAQIVIRRDNSPSSGDLYIDDLYAWDTDGSFNNDFIGDRRVLTLMPVSDTSSADYTSVGATGYQAIDDATANDATDYIAFAPIVSSAELIGEFGIDNLPSDVTGIAAIQTYVRMLKTEAGDCTMRVGFVSGGDIGSGDLHAITTAWTYWLDVFETDPDTGAPWTPDAFDAADLRIARED